MLTEAAALTVEESEEVKTESSLQLEQMPEMKRIDWLYQGGVMQLDKVLFFLHCHPSQINEAAVRWAGIGAAAPGPGV